MRLLKTFLEKLANYKIAQDEIRFLEEEKRLRDRIKGSTISKFSKKYNINSGTLSHMLRGKRAIPSNLIDYSDFKESPVMGLKNCNTPIKIPLELTEELAYLVGALRDGTVSQEKDGEYCVAFYSIHKDYLENLNNYIKKEFCVNREIERFGDGFGIRIRSKTLFLFFILLFEFKKKQTDWNTPTIIRESSDSVKNAYVSGFWDAEGGIPHLEKLKSVKRKNLYIKFVQKNKESLEFIKNHLDSLGIETGNVYWEKHKYVLKIRMSSIISFSQFINSLHPAKQKRLEMLTRLLT